MKGVAGAITEKQFMQQVAELARLTGWLVYHTHDSRRSAPGFPDLVMVRPPAVLFELKSGSGRLRPEQQLWLDALGKCGVVDTCLWRPSDWPEIEETLARGRSGK